MATKKTIRKTKTTKTRSASVDHNHIGKCFVAFGLIITAILFGFFYFLGQRKTYGEKQQLLAFRDLADNYIATQLGNDETRSTHITDFGMTKDNDLYADFVIETIEDHVPTAYQKARLHFQCRKENSLKLNDHCAFSFWYDDEVHQTSSKYREKYALFIEKSDEYVEKANAATTDEEKEQLKAEYEKFCDELEKDFDFDDYDL